MYNCYFGTVLVPTPDKMTVKIKGKNKAVTLLNEGEINVLHAPGLSEIQLSLCFPMLGTRYAPDYYLSMLETAKKSKKPFRFILTRTSPSGEVLFDTNMNVSLEDYTIKEDAKNGLDVSVDVNLKQYREYGTKQLILNIATNTASVSGQNGGQSSNTASLEKVRSNDSAPKAKTYTVVSGDCLWTIAAKYYGSGSEWTKIYNANKDKISNPNLIYPGQVLKIP